MLTHLIKLRPRVIELRAAGDHGGYYWSRCHTPLGRVLQVFIIIYNYTDHHHAASLLTHRQLFPPASDWVSMESSHSQTPTNTHTNTKMDRHALPNELPCSFAVDKYMTFIHSECLACSAVHWKYVPKGAFVKFNVRQKRKLMIIFTRLTMSFNV